MDSTSKSFGQRESVYNHNNNIATNHNAIINEPAYHSNHFTENEAPAVQSSTKAGRSNEPETVSTSLIDEGHFVDAVNQEQLPHVQPVTNEVENKPSHAEATSTVITSSTLDNDSANVASVAEDKDPDEMLNGAITKEDEITQVHSDNPIIIQSQPEELVNCNNLICDNAIIDEDAVGTSVNFIQPTFEENETVTSSDLVATQENETEEEDEITSDFTESLTAPLENNFSLTEVVNRCLSFEADIREEQVVSDNEFVLDADSTTVAPLSDSPPLDINNMTEEELDRYLSDLATLDSAGNTEIIDCNTTTTDKVVLEKDRDEKLSETHLETSQHEDNNVNLIDEADCVQASDSHDALPGEVAISEETEARVCNWADPNLGLVKGADEENVVSHGAASSEVTLEEATLVPVDATATTAEQCQIDANEAETSAITDECHSVVAEPIEKADSSATVQSESTRPNTLTIPSEVATEEGVVDEQQVDAPATSSEDIVNSEQPSTSESNRGGLVLSTYFERQEMPNGLTEEEQMLGKVKPFWIPDEEALNCLHCDAKFTFIKRRHHCRLVSFSIKLVDSIKFFLDRVVKSCAHSVATLKQS